MNAVQTVQAAPTNAATEPIPFIKANEITAAAKNLGGKHRRGAKSNPEVAGGNGGSDEDMERIEAAVHAGNTIRGIRELVNALPVNEGLKAVVSDLLTAFGVAKEFTRVYRELEGNLTDVAEKFGLQLAMYPQLNHDEWLIVRREKTWLLISESATDREKAEDVAVAVLALRVRSDVTLGEQYTDTLTPLSFFGSDPNSDRDSYLLSEYLDWVRAGLDIG
jgi:hypothetical protein